MKIDHDPDRNRAQFEKLRKFSVKGSLIFRRWFWIFMGLSSVISGVILVFTSAGTIDENVDRLTQLQYGVAYIFLGIFFIALPYIASSLLTKINSYSKRDNNGDEWMK